MHFITRRHFSCLVAGVCLEAYGAGFPVRQAEAQTPGSPAPRYPLTGEVQDAFAAFMAYDPATDPDAPFFRSGVPRAERIPAFAAVQAQPHLSALPQLASLTGCYRSLGPHGDDRYRRQRYGNAPKDGVYVSRMIGPMDVIVGWSGTGIVPNPALTDVAHRNGALCLGLIFQPDKRMFDSSAVPARKVAAQYARLAVYFGFDGYFVNFESGTPAGHEQVLRLITMMREEAQHLGKHDFYVQFYDGSADMEQLQPKLAGAGSHGRSEADSAMLDQGWSGYSMVRGCCSGKLTTPELVQQYCEKNGLAPFRSAYFGFQLYPGPGYLGVAAPSVIAPNGDGSAFGSLQIYSYEDGFWTMRRAATESAGVTPSPLEAEEAFYDLERRFFSGQSGNPALANKPTAEQAAVYAEVAQGTRRYADYAPGTDPKTEQVTLPITYGVLNFTAERSVIGAFPFLTHFNVGAGQGFSLDGKQVSARPWFNLGIQDLLPTWQWRMQPIDGLLDSAEREFAPLRVRYDGATAFQGGSSLHITGMLRGGERVALYLYKTRLAIRTKDSGIHVVWQGSADTVPSVDLGLVFEDAPKQPVWLPWRDTTLCTTTTAAAGWMRSQFELGPYCLRTLAAVVLGFSATPDAVDGAALNLRLGELYAGRSGQAAPASAPLAFTAVGAASPQGAGAMDVRFHWQGRGQDAWYDLFSVDPNSQQRSWLGRVSAECFFAEAVPCAPGVPLHFELVATSKQTPLTGGIAARTTLLPV